MYKSIIFVLLLNHSQLNQNKMTKKFNEIDFTNGSLGLLWMNLKSTLSIETGKTSNISMEPDFMSEDTFIIQKVVEGMSMGIPVGVIFKNEEGYWDLEFNLENYKFNHKEEFESMKS